MSRNPIRHGQHDTSIIGNLPERLQKKIAVKAGVINLENRCLSACHADGVKNGAGTEKTVTEDIPGLDFFLKRNTKHCASDAHDDAIEDEDEVSNLQKSIPGILRLNNTNGENGENSGGVQKRRAAERSPMEESLETGATPTIAATPGIIRLNTTERTRLTKPHRNKSCKYGRIHAQESVHKVLKPKNALHEEEIVRELMPLSPARAFISKKYPQWFDDAQVEEYSINLHQLYDTLTGLMQQNALLQHWSYFLETEAQMLRILKQILLKHLKFCCEMKCDNLFWKLIFYNVREYLKFANTKLAQDCLVELIDSGILFYKDLYNCLKLKYLTNADYKSSNVDKDNAHISKSEKFEIIAKVAAQKLLICLGDLCRYKALQLQSNDLSDAASYYREAQVLIPSNGIPYNQLAIVAIRDRKKFEAIYLHMRSLMSSNSIQSARESLLVLFDEIRKKFEKTEQKVSPIHQYKNSNAASSSNCTKAISPLRKEVWIHPDGVRRLHRTNVDCKQKLTKPAKNVELRLDEMSSDDLLHRFISIYLYVIGKLYTGIGMETIQAHQNKLLTQLNALLKRNSKPLLITRSKMLKIVSLNIFILYHNVQQDNRREIRNYTFTFCNQMFGIFLQKCNQLFVEFKRDGFNKEDSVKELNTLLQFVKVYIDYMALNVDIWEPIRSEEQYFIDPWNELQTLFEYIDDLLDEQNIESGPVLEENQFLYGFTPLLTLHPKQFKFQTVSSESSQFFARIAHIKKFQTLFTKHLERLQLEETEADSSFVLEELNSDIKTALEILHNVAENEVDIENKTPSSSTDGVLARNKSLNDLKPLQQPTNSDEQVQQLTKLKKELEHQTNAKRVYNSKLEEILKLVDTKVYIEVRPKYLLPDTNCFIDHLEDFEKLLKNYKRYILVIPLTVVRELDGLSKGVKLEMKSHFMQQNRIHHFDDVSTNAKKSLDFIRNTKQNVKCATTKGSIINASLFALVEEEYMSNDDRILATALALSKTMSRETSKDDKCFIQTELVLITTDRNLRVKALSRNLAVSELDEFLLWARDCNDG